MTLFHFILEQLYANEHPLNKLVASQNSKTIVISRGRGISAFCTIAQFWGSVCRVFYIGQFVTNMVSGSGLVSQSDVPKLANHIAETSNQS